MESTLENCNFEDLPLYFDIQPNEVVFISADLHQIALNLKKKNKRINIDLFVEKLQALLPEGTLIFPAYTDQLQSGQIFDPKKDKPTTGSVSNRIFKRKDFIRSHEPLHSVFAWGKLAPEIQQLSNASTFGPDSIFALLHRHDAKFIFIDVHIVNSFTFVHYIEEILKVNYRKYKKINYLYQTESDQQIPKTILFFAKKWGFINDFDRLNSNLLDKKIMQTINYDGVTITYLKAKAGFIETKRTIESNEIIHGFEYKIFIKDMLRSVRNFIFKR